MVGAGVLVLVTNTLAPAPAPAEAGVAVAASPAPAQPSEPAPTVPGSAPTTSPTSPTRTTSTSPSSDGPTRRSPTSADQVAFIEVGSVGIRTAVDARGLSADGTISPPRGTVMWFRGYGRVMPGLVGTSVVAGHVAIDGSPDVFAHLPEVRTGQRVRVGYKDGEVLDLRVVRTKIVDKSALQTDADVWGANSSSRRVVLITCDDAYGFRSDGHRVANFVAVAEVV
jgi:LPXTG-site transpeptidase (sortase) family protein